MVQMSGIYQGEKRCEMTHGPSQARLHTDAPRDNHGKGEAFSPTDMVGAALATCAITTMAIFADKEGVDLKGSHFTVSKEMQVSPRQISRLTVQIHLPKFVSAEQRLRFEEIGRNCPVKRSLNAQVESPIEFIWDL